MKRKFLSILIVIMLAVSISACSKKSDSTSGNDNIVTTVDTSSDVVIDKDSEKILGATMICEDSNEIIHLIQLAIDMEVKYTYLRDRVYAHPTMTEALNDVLSPAMIKEI